MSGQRSSQIINEAAALWAVRADECLDDTTRQDLCTWLAADTKHVGAYARARALLISSRRLRSVSPTNDESIPVESDTLDYRPHRRALLGGGAFAFAAAAGGLFWANSAQACSFATRRGEISTFRLPDGSEATLDTDSQLITETSPLRRQVELIDGKAFLSVKPEDLRSLSILAGPAKAMTNGAAVTVIQGREGGTSFSVHTGTLEIAPRVGGESQRIQANTRIFAAPDGTFRLEPLDPDALRRELMWRQGLLAFEDERLDKAAEQFARYSDVVIDLPDEKTRQATVTGMFSARDPHGFAKAVCVSLGLRCVADRDGVRIEPEKI